LKSGTRLGTYEIVELLGSGGMGSVYRAHDTKLGREVAIKVLLADLVGDPTLMARFEREAKVLASINHPNIATIFGFDDSGGIPFLVLELLEGETLSARLRRGAMEPADAVGIGIQIARALEAAHEQSVVHRDLKPSNVMLCPRDIVKVLDFGIAKASRGAGVEMTSGHTYAADLTATGALVGTVPYMSPEQIRGHELDRRTDVWAFGCVLFEALTGTPAFARETAGDTLAAILEHEPRWDLLPEAAPEVLRQLLARCLRKDVERRARDFWDVRLELEEALASLAPAAADTTDASAAGLAPSGLLEPQPTASESRAEPARHAALEEGERRQATVLISTVGGYGAMVEQLAPAESEETLAAIHRAAEEVMGHHGGVVNRFGGGELVALFGIPTAHEDDSQRAIRAALDLHARVRDLAGPIENRIGEKARMQTAVHAGPLVARAATSSDEAYTVSGALLQIADRLASEAGPDEILLSGECNRLAAPFFHTEEQEPITLRGTKERILAHRVIGESGRQSRLDGAEPLTLTKYMGRDHELAFLNDSLAEAGRGSGQLVSVEGEAGAGKSRLLYEFHRGATEGVSGLAIIEGRCQSYGVETPYLPFIEALKGILGLGSEEISGTEPADIVARIVEIDPGLEHFVPLYLHLLSIESQEYELPQYLQSDDFRMAMLEALAAIFTLPAKSAPLLMVLEDWHWADAASQEVLRQLAAMVSAYRMLIVVSHRPEGEFDWGRADIHQRLTLDPLSETLSSEIINSVLGVESFPGDLAKLIHERTGGNPFFLEELCHSLAEDGIVRIEDGQATLAGSLNELYLPDTVQAVILTRLDRLERDARDVLRLGSVVGREFSRRILEATVADTVELLPALEDLKDLGVIQQVAVVPEALYRFKHVLTQEVAYSSLLHHRRRALHGHVGEAIEQLYTDRLDEFAGRLARHFAAAEGWEKAVEYGRRSANNAKSLYRFGEALAALENVHAWLHELPDGPAQRKCLVDVLLEMERACEPLGRRSRQNELIDELKSLLEPEGESVELAETLLRQGELLTVLGRFEEAQDPLLAAVRICRGLGERERERAVLRGLGFLRWHEERYEEAIECNEKAVEVSRSLEDPDALARDLANLASVMRSAGRADEALEHMKEALQYTEATGNPANHNYLLGLLGRIYRDQGDDDSALEAIGRAYDVSEEHRLYLGLCFHLNTIANIHWDRGNTEECLAHYEQMANVGRDINYAEGLAMATQRLGELLISLDRHEEALPHLEENVLLSARLHDKASEARSLTQIAEIHERAGRHEETTSAWQAVQKLREDTRDEGGELEAHEGLARVARVSDGARALDHYQRALALAIGLEDLAKQADLLNSIAIVEWRGGNYLEALGHYERALAIFQQLEDEVHEGLVMNSIAVTLRDMDKPIGALVRAEEALEVNRRTGQQMLEGHTLAIIGDLHFHMNNPEDSMNHYRASLEIRRAINDHAGEGWMLHRLAKLSATQGMADVAASYANEAAEIAKESHDAELQGACAELKLRR